MNTGQSWTKAKIKYTITGLTCKLRCDWAYRWCSHLTNAFGGHGHSDQLVRHPAWRFLHVLVFCTYSNHSPKMQPWGGSNRQTDRQMVGSQRRLKHLQNNTHAAHIVYLAKPLEAMTSCRHGHVLHRWALIGRRRRQLALLIGESTAD